MSTDNSKTKRPRKRKEKRPVSDYVEAARKLSKFVPSLKKYRRRKTLTRYEKAAITRKQKALQYTDHLIPITKKQYKKLKRFTPGPGIQAVQLRNTGAHTKISFVRDNMMVTSNGRTWLYWELDRAQVKSKKGMTKAAREAFAMQFPVERIAALAQKAFEDLEPLAVYLWAPSGRVGRGFQDLPAFIDWLHENWNIGRYTQQEKWVNGIAILLQEGEHEEDEENDE